MRKILLLFYFLLSTFLWSMSAEDLCSKVKEVDIISWTHTDYGFTDHPLVLMELQKRFIDIAVDYAEMTSANCPGERFTWTIEALDPLYHWWWESAKDRRKLLLKAIRNNQIDVNIMPFNVHPYYNDKEMDCLISWLPEELEKVVRPSIAIQNDVNGFPRAAARRIAEKGVGYVWLGMNGRHPFPIPNLSKWDLGDGQAVWLWNGGSYWDAYEYFAPSKWRTWQCQGADPMFRWPREGEMFASDEASVREAHEICVKKIKSLECKGYYNSIITNTFSNQWRCDNDGPFFGLVDFVKTWNRLGLQPILKLSTATESMERLVKSLDADVETVSGEFFDWWAFGLTAMPRELSAVRRARYQLQASVSDVFGTMPKRLLEDAKKIERDICTYYEHTFASMDAGKDTYGQFNQGTEVFWNNVAHRACALADWQVAQRLRTRCVDLKEGVYIFNTQKSPYTGWLEMEFITLRDGKATGLKDAKTGEKYFFDRVGSRVRFWVNDLDPESMHHLQVIGEPVKKTQPLFAPEIHCNEYGWPVSVRWEGMQNPLFDGDIAMLMANKMTSGGWWAGNAVYTEYKSLQHPAKVEESEHSITYIQKLTNDHFVSAERHLTVYRAEPRVKVKVIWDRVLHPERYAEVLGVAFPFPNIDRTIRLSNGGVIFTPYEDHIPNTCNTFNVVDSWVAYSSPDGTRVWSSKTSPVVTFGNMNFDKAGIKAAPENDNILYSMVYNNLWGTNFMVEYSGKVESEYDLYYTPDTFDAEQVRNITDTYNVGPLMTISPKAKENKSYRKWINGEEL